jgi:proline dehydrogenase
MHILYPIAKRYIAGEDVETALHSMRKIVDGGYQCSIDILGENITDADQAENAMREYLRLLELLKPLGRPMDLSIKVTQMGIDIDHDLCRRNIETLLSSAPPHTIRFDMEGSTHTQATIDLCVEMHRQHELLGQALQAYLHRTAADVERLISEKISVRLCKGAYKEPAEIALHSMDAIRDNFLNLARKLLKDGHLPAIATHDETLLKEILTFIEREKIDRESFYFEMLYGVRRDLQKYLRDKGFRMRVYTPFGKSWLPYTLRRLGERKENIIFVIKHFLVEIFDLGKLR